MTTHVVCNVIFEIPACQLNVFTLLKFGTSRTRRAANKVRVRLALVSYLMATWTATKPLLQKLAVFHRIVTHNTN